jgi:glycosyltransferase involved in cell wall biosynthesis
VISVVMPAFNEATTLDPSVREVVEGLRIAKREFEIVIIENGSTDDTLEIARALAAELPEVVVVQMPVADYGRALRAGFLAAQGDYVFNFDVDYFDLEFLADALILLEGGKSLPGDTVPTIVVGSKRGRDAVDRRHWSRRVVTAGFSVALRTLFRLKVSDTHGMKGMHRGVLTPVVERCRFGADIFDTEFVLRAERAGLTVDELPVEVVERRPSRTTIVRRIPRSVLALLRLRVALWQESLRRDRSGP